MTTETAVQNSSEIDWRDSYEVYNFFVGKWDVNAARRLIEQNPRDVDTANIKECPVGLHVIHEENVDGADLSIPLIIIPIYDKGENIGVWIIDGWHRIAKAKRNKIDVLPCIMLTKEEADQIRIY